MNAEEKNGVLFLEVGCQVVGAQGLRRGIIFWPVYSKNYL